MDTVIQARDFSYLRGRLFGISDRMLGQHFELYEKYVKQLNAIEQQSRMTAWGPPGSTARVALDGILDAPVASLQLEPQAPLIDCIRTVLVELAGRKINFVPVFYLGEPDFWTTDRGVSINVPWFLANPVLWRLANQQQQTSFSVDQVMRCLRHEVGHAVCYAFEIWRRPDWQALFGDSEGQPYNESYVANAASRDHVEYLTNAPAHYPQKHPDEDFAEAFAAWLDAGLDWRARYAEWPGALAKLEYIERLWLAGTLQSPTNLYRGRPVPYTRLRGTVRQALGTGEGLMPFAGLDGWSEHSELFRREPFVWNGVVLHELYFEALDVSTHVVPVPIPPTLVQAVQTAWGSWESYMLDLRACAGSTSGWALTVWDARRTRLCNVLVEQHHHGLFAGCPVMLALDCWEHAYTADYGTRKDIYLGALLRNIDWRTVALRMPAGA